MAKISPVLFFRQVSQEISKVTWPTRRETMMAAMMVLVFTFLAAAFFFVVDQVLAFAVKTILGLGA